MSTSAVSELVDSPLATSVRIDEDNLHVELTDGRQISVPLAWFPRISSASAAERENWRLIGAGSGIHWEDLDEDLSVAGLLRGSRPTA